MSYDYNALVSEIASSRRKAEQALSCSTNNPEEKLQHLQQSVDSFSTLSAHCPMTPLLWMQYSKDTADLLLCLGGGGGEETAADTPSSDALETRLQLLELALSEFPGSAILQLQYLEILQLTCQQQHDSDNNSQTLELALTSALENVGKGSHRNEGVLVAAIFQLASDFYARQGKIDRALAKFIERAQTPMNFVNDSLKAQLEAFCVEHSSMISAEQRQETFRLLEEARRYVSKTFAALITCEDEVDVAMHKEGILSRHQVDLEQIDWDTMLRSDDKTCWMGYGGILSANSFIQYAQTCYRFRVRFHGKWSDLSEEEQQQIKEDETAIQELALCVYERGIADCPTVESLWLSYIQHLEYVVLGNTSLLSRLKSVVDRSVRNCPYSLVLYQQKLRLQGSLAEQGVAVFDPDELQKIVQEAIDAKFISSKEACFELYMTASRVLRKHLLSLLAKAPSVGSSTTPNTLAYDEPEPFNPSKISLTFSDFDDSINQEMEDLCDDCRDLYEAIDTYLKKNHGSWSEGRGLLWSEKAYMEANFLGPLSAALGDDAGVDSETASKQFTEVVKSYDKLIKVYQPTPPDAYTEYLHTFQKSFPIEKPSSMIAKIRQTRFLYQKALKSLGRPKHSTTALDPLLQRDFDSGLRNLCHEYLVFERYFGSEKSLTAASAAIQKKLLKFSPQDSQSDLPAAANIPTSLQTEQGTAAMQIHEKSLPTEKEDPTETEEEPSSTLPTKKHHLKESDDHNEPPSKKAKTQDAPDQSEDSQAPAETVIHKVKVGNLEYPAHPFTVRVFDLANETEDMDLVDTFRPKCGAIVHAKIMRDKHHHHDKGRSKGWGLVQFELQESVEKALALSEVIGIHEKLIKVDRSHMPAVGLVPPGMHRVKPKGGGKSSKKNLKRREAKGETAQIVESEHKETTSPPKTEGEAKAPKTSNNGIGILAFKPRGVTTGHRKVKVSLAPNTQETKKNG